MPNYTLGVDLSHYQLRPPISKLLDDGVEFFIIKVTQGMGVDPDFDYLRNAITQAGKKWSAYHWVLPTDDTKTAITHAVKQVLSKGDCLALDWEQNGVAHLDVETDMDIAEADLGRPGMVYRGKWPPDTLTARIAQWAWWYAQYPQNPNAAPGIPLWDGIGTPDWTKKCLIWQFTGNGRLPGVTTSIDENRILCPIDVLNGFIETGKLSSSASVPTSGEIVIPQPSSPTVTLPSVIFTGETLHINGSGPDYALLQTLLDKKYGANLNVDGHMGPATKAAVVSFQRTHGLQPDGIVGLATKSALLAA